MLPFHSPRSVNTQSNHILTNSCGFRPAARWIGLSCFLLSLLWLLAHARTPSKLPPPTTPKLATGKRPPYPVPSPFDPVPDWVGRKEQVKEAFLHAYGGYKKHAFPHDELASTTGKFTDKYNGWGVTLFDSLDTMWLMGLKEEFYEGMQFVKQQTFKIEKEDKILPFFETVIRYLGGLLSSYALSHDPTFLERADTLGLILLRAFGSSVFPAFAVDLKTHKTVNRQGNVALFAEIASCQLEFKYLAKMTERVEYYDRAENIMSELYDKDVKNGLFAERWFMVGGPYGQHFTVGANADSGYEYLLKQWILSRDVKARDQYIKSMEGIINKLLYVTPKRDLLIVTDMNYERTRYRMEHLSCFLPGLLALGVHSIDLPDDVRELHQWAAEGLAYTCWLSYADQPSGLGPDTFWVKEAYKWVDVLEEWKNNGREGPPPGLSFPEPVEELYEREYFNSISSYYLRPETIESMYILWKTTGDVRWRERGYEIFGNIERHSKTSFGYASIQRVDRKPFYKINDMPSYFLAETLKYLYLLFDDDDPISLDKWVFNTEAHPFPVFNWTEEERIAYEIFP